MRTLEEVAQGLDHQLGGHWSTRDQGVTFESSFAPSSAAKLYAFFDRHHVSYRVEPETGGHRVIIRSNARNVLMVAELETGNWLGDSPNNLTVERQLLARPLTAQRER